MNYTKCLEQFVQAGKKLLILDRQICSKPHRLLVLDLSFNPPHLAHFALAAEALRHDFGDEQEKDILLLLSVNNADKSGSDLHLFSHRLSMMHLMAEKLASLNVTVSIGLTTCAKFADKAQCLGEHFPNATLTFLLGFDTLVRVLDPKYYLPSTLAQSLEQFMTTSELFCLTRAGTAEEMAFQQIYVETIARGEREGIPVAWAKRVFVESLRGKNSIDSISSTSIRDSCAKGDHEDLALLEDVNKYIKDNRLYCQDASKV